MRKKWIVVGALVVAAAAVSVTLAFAGRSSGPSSTAHLLTSRVPTNATATLRGAEGARGRLRAKLILAGKKSSFTWTLNLRHVRGPVRRADIDVRDTSKSGTLVFPLCAKCSLPMVHGAYVGPYVATSSFVRALKHGLMYVTVTTKLRTNGAIRGRIRARSASIN